MERSADGGSSTGSGIRFQRPEAESGVFKTCIVVNAARSNLR